MYLTDYCELPELDLPWLDIPETEENILLNDQIITISCGHNYLRFHCLNEKLFVSGPWIPYDKNIIFDRCGSSNFVTKQIKY